MMMHSYLMIFFRGLFGETSLVDKKICTEYLTLPFLRVIFYFFLGP
jgi:hypothetical protein